MSDKNIDFDGLDDFVDNLRHGQEKEIKNLCCWLQLIIDIGYDHDGFYSAKDLGDLVDELVGFARDALAGKPCGPGGPVTEKI